MGLGERKVKRIAAYIRPLAERVTEPDTSSRGGAQFVALFPTVMNSEPDRPFQASVPDALIEPQLGATRRAIVRKRNGCSNPALQPITGCTVLALCRFGQR